MTKKEKRFLARVMWQKIIMHRALMDIAYGPRYEARITAREALRQISRKTPR